MSGSHGQGGEHHAWKAQRQRTLAEEEEEVGRVVQSSTGKDASLAHPVAAVSLAAFLCRSSPACAIGTLGRPL